MIYIVVCYHYSCRGGEKKYETYEVIHDGDGKIRKFRKPETAIKAAKEFERAAGHYAKYVEVEVLRATRIPHR